LKIFWTTSGVRVYSLPSKNIELPNAGSDSEARRIIKKGNNNRAKIFISFRINLANIEHM
jgi:hypothetical protein